MAIESCKMKTIGKPDEGKLQVRFDVAGYGNGMQLLYSVICSPHHSSTLLVICCQYNADAVKIKNVLGKRLAKYKLKLNEDKTKMVNFSKEKARQGAKQETFDFLGFTFYFGKSRQGFIIPMLKTSGKRYRAKLKRVNEWVCQVRNRHSLREIWKIFCSKIRGHTQYYGVSFNMSNVEKFLYESKRIMFKGLNRRSQRKSFNWDKFALFTKRFPLPVVKIYHKLF